MTWQERQTLTEIDRRMAESERARPPSPPSVQLRCSRCDGVSGLGFGTEAAARAAATMQGWLFCGALDFCGRECLTRHNWEQRRNGAPLAVPLAPLPPKSEPATVPTSRTVRVKCRLASCEHSMTITQTDTPDGPRPDAAKLLEHGGWTATGYCSAHCKAVAASDERGRALYNPVAVTELNDVSHNRARQTFAQQLEAKARAERLATEAPAPPPPKTARRQAH
jgi:hypothetical protein